MNNNFEELDRIAILLGVNEKEYFEAKNDYLNDSNSAMQKYFGYIDEEILTYLDFWYYYLAENTNCYFHNFGSTGYTKAISEYIKRNNIKVKDMDYNVFAEKESLYNETLFDILLSEINYNFYDEDYEIFGINVAGYKSNIYYITPKEVLKQVKNNKINSIEIFDFQKTEIFRTKKSHLFSELRLEQKIEEERVEEYLKQQKIAEEAAMEEAMKVYLHRKNS